MCTDLYNTRNMLFKFLGIKYTSLNVTVYTECLRRNSKYFRG